MLITATDFTDLTGDDAPENFAVLCTAVEAMLARSLGRHLASAERTEWVETYADGAAYVRATPVTDAGTFATDGRVVWTGQRGQVAVTYTGGFAPYGDEAAHALPADLALAVAYGVKTLAATGLAAAPAIPAGVTSINIAGEYSLTLAGGVAMGADGITVPASLVELVPLGGACARLAAPYRRL